MDNVDQITQILMMVLIGMVVILVVLGFVYLMLVLKNRKRKKQETANVITDTKNIKEENKKEKTFKEYTKESIFKFLEFKKIEDNMIIKDKTYLMVVECQGINFDLMSEMEQVSVEQGFMQFLNTLRYPIQLYIQTRTVNLQSSINGFNEKLKKIENKYRSMQMEYNNMVKMGNYPTRELQKYNYELTKQRNLYEYTLDIIKDTERTSLNHNVLNKKYYIIIEYDSAELEGSNYVEEEKQSMAFSELYTRCQSVIRTLVSCEIKGKILNSEELAELLYNAYNREDSDILNIKTAFQSGYEDLYSTAPDVLDKKMRILNQEIQKKAEELAQEKVNEVMSEKDRKIMEKEENITDLISDLAQDILQENTRYIGQDIVEEAIEKIQQEKENSEGGNKNEKDKTIRTRRGRPRRA